MARAADIVLNGLGVAGVALILGAYAGCQLDRLNPRRPAALLMNLAGSVLILLSLLRAFNLSAFLIEAAWAALALFGLIRWGVEHRRQGPTPPRGA